MLAQVSHELMQQWSSGITGLCTPLDGASALLHDLIPFVCPRCPAVRYIFEAHPSLLSALVTVWRGASQRATDSVAREALGMRASDPAPAHQARWPSPLRSTVPFRLPWLQPAATGFLQASRRLA